MKSNQNYNRELQPYAHKLRYSMTKAEACLWKYALQAKMMIDKFLPLPPPEGDSFSETIMSNQKLLKETTLN